MKQKGPKHLYHYCSFENFKSMIVAQTIRLSDLSKTNDPREDQIILELINKVAKKMNISCDSSINLLDKSRRQTKILGICFTETKNSHYFYETYCRCGGLSISFKYENLKNFFNKVTIYNNRRLCLKKVIYINDSSIIKELENKVANIIKNEGSVLNCGSYLFLDDNFYKDGIWEDEKEYRIGFRIIFPDEIINGEEPLNKQYHNLMPSIKYDGENYFAIPLIDRSYFYIELPFEMSLIEKIFVPWKFKNMFKETLNSIKNVTEEYSNFDFEELLKKVKYVRGV